MRICPNCQNTVSDAAAKFCDNCGGPLPAPADPVGSPAGQFKPPNESVGGKPPTGGEVANACPNCGFSNQPGSLFCDNCGLQLPPVAVKPPSLPIHLPPSAPTPSTVATRPIGDQLRRAEIEIPPITIVTGRFETQDSGAIIYFPRGKPQIMIGREDPVDGAFPEIDLNPYRGEELGVSRRHALISIESGRLFIEDLGSTNYTHLNQNRLLPNQRYQLNDGDEIRFGRFGVVYRDG